MRHPVAIPADLIHLFHEVGIPACLERLKDAKETPLFDRVPRKGLDLGPDIVLELHQRRAIVRGEAVQLTPTESRLLFALAANRGQIVTTETLLTRGWAGTDEAEPSYV